MKLGCVDHAFPLLGAAETCRLIALLGLDTVDFALWGGERDSQLAVARRDVAGTVRTLRTAADTASLEISDLFILQSPTFDELAINHPDDAVRAQSRVLFGDALEIAVRLGVPGLTILPGIDWPGEDPQRSLERSVEQLAWRADDAQVAGVRLSVEPHVGSVIAAPARVSELLERVPNLELTLDYSHFVFAGVPPREVDPFLSRARHVHARGARLGRLQTPLSHNTIDFEAVVGQMDGVYDGGVALEYLWADIEIVDACDNVAETLQLASILRGAAHAGH